MYFKATFVECKEKLGSADEETITYQLVSRWFQWLKWRKIAWLELKLGAKAKEKLTIQIR